MFLCQFLEKKGFSSLFPGLSCKEIRDSGDSEADGEYWIDPAKDGNSIKVYCDMTTDGGKIKFSVSETFYVQSLVSLTLLIR